jgi:hypothetical protein
MQLDEDVRRALTTAAQRDNVSAPTTEHRVATIVARGRHLRRRRQATIAAVTTVSALAVGLAIATTSLRPNNNRPIEEIAAPSPSTTSTSLSTAAPSTSVAPSTSYPDVTAFPAPNLPTATKVKGRWTLVPEAPIAPTANPLVVANDSDVLVFGGSTEPSDFTSGNTIVNSPYGALFNIASQTWRPITPDPDGWRNGYSWAWDQQHLFLYGGWAADGKEFGLQMYDPSNDSWTTFGFGPLEPRRDATMVWTGRELLIGGGNEVGPTEDRPASGGAAFDPVGGTWRSLANNDRLTGLVSSYWVGERWLIRSGSIGGPRLATYDPVTDQWTNINYPSGLPTDAIFTLVVRGDAVVVSWFGSTVSKIGTVSSVSELDTRYWSLDVRSSSWTMLSELPEWVVSPYTDGVTTTLGPQQSGGTNIERLANDRVIRYREQGWQELPSAPIPSRMSGAFVELPTGGLFTWGGSTFDRESSVIVRDGAMFEPGQPGMDYGSVVQGEPCTFEDVTAPTVEPGSEPNSFDVTMAATKGCDVWGFPVLLSGIDAAGKPANVSTHNKSNSPINSVTQWTPGVSLNTDDRFTFTVVERACAQTADDARSTLRTVTSVQFRLPRTSEPAASRAPGDPDFSAPAGLPVEISTPFANPIRCLAVTGFRPAE